MWDTTSLLYSPALLNLKGQIRVGEAVVAKLRSRARALFSPCYSLFYHISKVESCQAPYAIHLDPHNARGWCVVTPIVLARNKTQDVALCAHSTFFSRSIRPEYTKLRDAARHLFVLSAAITPGKYFAFDAFDVEKLSEGVLPSGPGVYVFIRHFDA